MMGVVYCLARIGTLPLWEPGRKILKIKSAQIPMFPRNRAYNPILSAATGVPSATLPKVRTTNFGENDFLCSATACNGRSPPASW